MNMAFFFSAAPPSAAGRGRPPAARRAAGAQRRRRASRPALCPRAFPLLGPGRPWSCRAVCAVSGLMVTKSGDTSGSGGGQDGLGRDQPAVAVIQVLRRARLLLQQQNLAPQLRLRLPVTSAPALSYGLRAGLPPRSRGSPPAAPGAARLAAGAASVRCSLSRSRGPAQGVGAAHVASAVSELCRACCSEVRAVSARKPFRAAGRASVQLYLCL